MKKILYLITLPEAGGAQTYVLDLAVALKNDFDITVASSGKNTDWLPVKLTSAQITWYPLIWVKRSIDPIKDLRAIFEIRRLIKKINPDIIHLNSSKISILGSLAALGLGKKTIYTAHGWVFLEPLPTYIKKIYLWAEKLSAKHKNKVICVSEYDRAAARVNKFPMDKLITIHNGINLSQNKESRPEIKDKFLHIYPLPRTSYIVGSIANLYLTKNLPALVTSATNIIQKNKDVIFTVIGDGPEKNNLENQILDKGLDGKFFLLGSIPNAKQYLPAWNIFVLPSVKEGLPYTLLEAMAVGLPIVATRVGGIFEILEFYPQTHYRLVEPNDTAGLTNAISELLTQTPLDIKSLTRVREQIDIKNMIENTKAVYLK